MRRRAGSVPILAWSDEDVALVARVRLGLREGAVDVVRQGAGLSVRAMADSLGVDRLTLTRWLRGVAHPCPDDALRLAKLVVALEEALAPDSEPA